LSALANPGDPVDGVTQQWPDDRQAVVAGHLALTRLREDQLSPFTVTAAPDEVPAIGELRPRSAEIHARSASPSSERGASVPSPAAEPVG
jgi:hypothetical protein